MNLQPVTGPPFTAICYSCQRPRRIALANLDGEAFKSWYCEECAAYIAALTEKPQTQKETQ